MLGFCAVTKGRRLVGLVSPDTQTSLNTASTIQRSNFHTCTDDEITTCDVATSQKQESRMLCLSFTRLLQSGNPCGSCNTLGLCECMEIVCKFHEHHKMEAITWNFYKHFDVNSFVNR